jgi:outer membrane biosynthesis protein TonB
MGVLDDAIREHLELKRRHGASDDEVAKEEAEALGPARRDFPAQPAAEGEAQRAEAEGAEAQAAEAQGAEPVPEPVVEPPPEPMPEPAPEPEPELETRDSKPETESEPEPEEQPEKSDEDVLEETPEFLQDAPEHDRLWFEQKPPRDFDFE